MPVNIFPFTALTVFEKQQFSNSFVVPAGTTVNSYNITTTEAVGSNWSANVKVTSNATTSILISGYYDNVFIRTTIRVKPNVYDPQIVYTNFEAIPTNPYPYAILSYAPDSRKQIAVTITINCNTGTTSLTQYVRNDYNYYRNRILTLIHNDQVDAKTNTTYVAPNLPSPCSIDSETLKNVFIFSTSISTNIVSYNLLQDAIRAGYTQTNALFATVTIQAGAYLWTSSVGTAAFYTGTLPSGVGAHSITINNYGYIQGQGGNGGPYRPVGNGLPGGPAMYLAYNISLNNQGYIGGGGGGGGSGSGGGGAGGGNGGISFGGAGATVPGGYGANGTNQGSSPAYSMNYGGGGGRVMPGAGGAGRGGYGTPGLGGGAGGGGGHYNSLGTGGSGGSGGAVGGSGSGSVGGGGGGGWGAAGGLGVSFGNYPGGAGGAAIVLNGYSITYVNTGTIYGAVA